jgi:tRNA 2-thiouridine synthesizing protein A
VANGIGGAVGVRRTETSLIVWAQAAPGPESQPAQTPAATPKGSAPPIFEADTFFDAGSKGCAEGPMDQIAALMRKLEAGQTLEIRATDPSVSADLSAWCRMTGHTLVEQRQDRYLLRHK